MRSLSFFNALFVSAVLVGCDLNPYCLTCDEEGELGDGGTIDADARPMRRDTGVNPDAELDGSLETPDACVAGAPEVCNSFDDDCDGTVDEGIDLQTSAEHCGACNRRCAPPGAFGECRSGECEISSCDVGHYDRDQDPANGCEYRCVPVDSEESRCDRRDDDCDGMLDEDFDLQTDSNNCGACGRTCRAAHATSSCATGMCSIQACEPGFYDRDGVALNGCEYACTPASPATEQCNLRDDDCDGMVDEGDPGSGGSCGMSAGACAPGVLHCVSGALACTGGVSPSTETCNNVDDDCDSSTDENNPEGGGTCGSGVGTCQQGREQCVGGALRCEGAVSPATEHCNTLDDDCDGRVDEMNPDGGGLCGSDTGECTAGRDQCMGGTLVCSGSVGARIETCNGLDDDCDSTADEGFYLNVDPTNCGMCGRVCSFTNGTGVCNMGTCTLAACNDGYVNADGSSTNGCEFRCDFAGAEVCNGRDDDCDMRTDEGLTAPSNFCNPNGVCAGATATCGGGAGWVCNYPATYQSTETRCDGLDNDCNGRVDDPFTTLGTACNNGGIGACRRTGTYVCNAAMDGTRCNAPAPGSGTAEICDGLDNDCDGVLDDGAPLTWTPFTLAGGAARWIMAYEASRPDSTATATGALSHRVCSEPSRMPWVNVTYPQAAAACATVGARLCTEAEWQRSCETSAATACTYSYSASCGTYAGATCNGNDYDSSPAAGDQDAVLATGSLPMCYANWGGSSRVYDLSGNVKEWTTARSSGVNPLRGGSNLDPAGGLACGYNFVVANDSFATPNVGFRCCRDTAP